MGKLKSLKFHFVMILFDLYENILGYNDLPLPKTLSKILSMHNNSLYQKKIRKSIAIKNRKENDNEEKNNFFTLNWQ